MPCGLGFNEGIFQCKHLLAQTWHGLYTALSLPAIETS